MAEDPSSICAFITLASYV